MSQEKLVTKIITVKEIWNRKPFARNDGTTGYIQTIIPKAGASIKVWDKEELDVDLLPNMRLKITNLREGEYNGYQQFSTTDDSKIITNFKDQKKLGKDLLKPADEPEEPEDELPSAVELVQLLCYAIVNSSSFKELKTKAKVIMGNIEDRFELTPL